jgi:serine/threonine protein kinase
MPDAFRQGTLVSGRYEILGLLGTGGMGEIYRARRLRLGDEVAIKVIRTTGVDDEALRDRFMRESRACARLRHPHIVAIHDFDVDDERRPFLVMELLNGPSVREELAQSGRFDLARLQKILPGLCSALQLAHDNGIVHRDLKPANIVSHRYESGELVYKIIDFGLANVRAAADETRLTTERQFLGTVTYASPEQLRGQVVDQRSDVYSAGAVVYEMITGRAVFDAADSLAAATQHLMASPEPPSRFRADLPGWVDAAVLRALAKQPDDRWPRIEDFALAMQGAAAHDAATGLGHARAPALSGMLGKYDLGLLIGRGRFGSEVYAARHRALGHPVAVRTLHRRAHPNWDAARDRFLREAQALQVWHPSIIQVRDYGEESDVVYVVTELLEGVSLRELLTHEGALPWPRLAPLADQLLDAIETMHRRGGTVCGLSPEIIRMTRDEAGERLMISSAGIVQVQDLLGTLSLETLRGGDRADPELPYVAPEVFMGRAPDTVADVFTIGVLLYEMATGRVPFEGRTLPSLLGAALGPPPPLAHDAAPGVPPAVSDVVARCLVADPAARLAPVAEVRRRLSDATR